MLQALMDNNPSFSTGRGRVGPTVSGPTVSGPTVSYEVVIRKRKRNPGYRLCIAKARWKENRLPNAKVHSAGLKN